MATSSSVFLADRFTVSHHVPADLDRIGPLAPGLVTFVRCFTLWTILLRYAFLFLCIRNEVALLPSPRLRVYEDVPRRQP